MFYSLKSAGLKGIDGCLVEVETDISNGLPSFDIVGLGDTAVREARERVRSAIRNSGFEFPVRRITMNLAPANLKKEGSSFDLAMAVGILAATGQIETNQLETLMFIGELSLDGGIKSVNGVLPMAICALKEGIKSFVLPEANAGEAAIVKGIDIIPVKNLRQLSEHLNGFERIEGYERKNGDSTVSLAQSNIDFADVKGQENVKRALEVAASGAHNCIMIGAPGSGKTMLAKRLPTILPAMTFDEALEVTKIHSIAGTLPSGSALITARPFRSPHHTISETALVGGGTLPKPGEISLAHYGVLFLDELPEFSRKSLEVLRQPLEDGSITISRINASLTYPAKTTLICAANPCKCGRFLDPGGQCTCTPNQIRQYLGRLSGPLMDRMDIQIEIASINYRELEKARGGEDSCTIRQRVDRARKIQQERYKGMKIYANSQLEPGMLDRFCRLDEMGRKIMRNAFEKLGLSARAYSRILRVARTIADMDGSEDIKSDYLAEAIQYRSLDRKVWNM